MWNEPSNKELCKIPTLYSTENIPLEDKLIYMHFFLGGCDCYIAEYNAMERIFFGYAILNNDLQNSEWGYISYDEIRELKTPQGFEVDRDLHWKSQKAIEIDQIKLAYKAQGYS